ncbi:cytochrome c [Myxococcus sp. RHSTA-1-4]|uniref:cytochrome c n=1 Tax=Myxococcus sp. RHSTA-1-4 TaxID=2874601 RepID=UPI001CBE310B|nr:cytochrome c [Myxococcus sp. RHSTA-1-4]MBZ4416266.1 cytochrome c [Myxococcus sp. RHSTA-1-4]
MMKTLRIGLPVLLLSLGLVMHAQASEPASPKPKKAPKPATSLPAPDYLPAEARAALRKKMARHGQAMTDLMLGVTLLQYDVASAAAGRIVNEPRLSRPVPDGADELNTLLPERFFTYQDEARSRAQAVQTAAQKRDDAALAESFGRLTETCVGCHSAYLSHRK